MNFRPFRVLAAAVIVGFVASALIAGALSGDTPWEAVRYTFLGLG